MSFPTYETLAFSHEPHQLAANLASEVTRRLAAAVDPRVEAAVIANELRDLGYALTTAGYFADRQVFEVRRPPDSAQPGVRLTLTFPARKAEAALLLPETEPSPLAARVGAFAPRDARWLLDLVMAPAVDLAAVTELLNRYHVALRGLQLELRLDELGLRGWLTLQGADLDLTTRPVTLVADADVAQPGLPAQLYSALLQFAHAVGLPDPGFVFDALRGGALEARVELVAHALGGRLQRLQYGEADQADASMGGLLASGLFSTRGGASVEVLLAAVAEPEIVLVGLQRVAERYRVRIHAGASIRPPAPTHHDLPG